MESRLFRQSWNRLSATSARQTSFQKVGDQVAKGEVICIIEAMKLMNEITSEADGVITEIACRKRVSCRIWTATLWDSAKISKAGKRKTMNIQK